MVAGSLNETTFASIDVLQEIARADETTVARVALAWVRIRPGVTSTIIGARRLAQLEDNVQLLGVQLTADELARLDALTKPKVGFPQSMGAFFPAIHNGGTMVNGVQVPPSAYGLVSVDKPY